MPPLLISDRQDAIQRILDAGYWIQAHEAHMIARLLDIPEGTALILEDNKALLEQMPNRGQCRSVGAFA
jgi:hypothetical protein